MKRNLVFLSAILCTTASLVAVVDTNDNGLSDLWEKEYNNGDLFADTFDPQADPDADGWTNAQEAAAGTDPFSSALPSGHLQPETEHIPATWGDIDNDDIPDIITPDVIRISWEATPGKQYTLLTSVSMQNESWTPVGTPFIGTGTVVSYNFLTSQAGRVFLRVAVCDTDSDEDGLNDSEEYFLQTDPSSPDSDEDGLPDGWEVSFDLDPTDNGSIDPANGPAGDPDDDGITNLVDSNPRVPDEIIVVIKTDSLTIIPSHQGLTTYTEKFSLDRLMDRNQDQNGEPVPVAQVSYDSGTGLGHLSLAEISLEAGTELPYSRTLSFFNLLDTDFPSLASAGPEIQVRECIQLTIPSGSNISNTVGVHPGITEITTTTPDLKSGALVGPVKVEWKAVAGHNNVSDHVDPWSDQINGLRIFPDYEDPTKTTIRHAIEVIVKTSPALAGKQVFVKSFDVDDSTSEEFDKLLDQNTGTTFEIVIDTNGKAGSDNTMDYLNTPKPGQFWNGTIWGSDAIQGTVNTNGETKFTFKVGMQPGNNYRIVASVIDESMYQGVQTSNPTLDKYLGFEIDESGEAPASPLLTVWRNLWVENDSMQGIPLDVYLNKRNDLNSDVENPIIRDVNPQGSSAGQTEFEIEFVSDETNFLSFQNGRIKTGGEYYPVIATRSINAGLDQAPESYVKIVDGHPTITANMGYRLYDDDDFKLNRSPLPRLDIVDDVIKNVYKPAFIDIRDASAWNLTKEIPFYRNAPELVGALRLSHGIWADALDAALLGNENLWCTTVIAGYQGSVTEDSDPKTEGPATEGITPVRMVAGYPYTDDEARYSIVWVENIRDNLDDILRNPGSDNPATNEEIVRRIKLTAAHEIGHQPSYMQGEGHHDELGLMQEGGDDGIGPGENSKFRALSIKRFRNVKKWREE
jgi:hypothetical protein